MQFLDIIRYFGALFLVLGLVGVAGIVVRRYGLPGVVGGSGRRMAVVETLMLGGRHRLFLVRCDQTEHVLVVGPAGATLVNTLDAKPSFHSALQQSIAPPSVVIPPSAPHTESVSA